MKIKIYNMCWSESGVNMVGLFADGERIMKKNL